ncbi:hypothetical protein HHK36_023632 [Tetracentron sinense]|uniref:Small ribosomal subunit protein uS5c n=1 Tax=Tetracentron sinense TaxID=13715 RepID=A0A834YRI9_TETSI|nr:hypothetical protein HHK36_023632 [Tetracentron sinense]
MAVSATTLSSFSSLSIHKPHPTIFKLSPNPIKTSFFSLPQIKPNPSTASFSFPSKPHKTKPIKANSNDTDTTFFDEVNPEDNFTFEPIEPPEGYVPPPAFDEGPPESEDEIAAAYEEIYGPAYSGMSVLGNNINVMDSKVKKTTGLGGKVKKEKVRDGFDERVVQVRRVTKVVKGGKQLHFRAIVVVGDKQGQVGVGVGKAKEVIAAVQKSATNARRNIITVPLTKYSTFPHSGKYIATTSSAGQDINPYTPCKSDAVWFEKVFTENGAEVEVQFPMQMFIESDGDYGAAKVMLRPASPGTGVIAGGSVRIVLEMAGVENALGKQLGSNNALNNARATVVAVQKMRQFSEVARDRGIPMEELWK